MSHFVVMCLVPNDISPLSQHIEAFLGAMLAPYDENMELDEYETDCHCCGDEAEAEIRELADKEFGTWAAMREVFATEKISNSEIINAQANARLAFVKKNPDAKEGEITWAVDQAANPFWQRDYWGPRNEFEKKSLAEHPDKNKPSSTCGFYSGERRDWWPESAKEGDRYDDESGCGGTGRVMSTYNPESKWDWWTVGGRWNGYFKPEWDPTKDEANLEECWHCKGTGFRKDERALGWARDKAFAQWIEDSGLTEEEKGELKDLWVDNDSPLKGLGQKVLSTGLLFDWIAKVPDAIGEPVGLAFRAIVKRTREEGYPCNGCTDGKSIKFPSNQEQRGVISSVTKVLQLNKEGHNVIPFAILTHREDYGDHQWMQRGEMGWWAVVHDGKDQDDWKSQVLQVLEDHIGDAAIIVDCHI